MEFEKISDCLDIYTHSVGSMAYCAKSLRAKLEGLGNDEALAYLDGLDEKLGRARRMQYDWQQRKVADPMRRREAQAWDNRVDRSVGGLHSAILPFAEMEVETEAKKLASEIKEDLFPSGVRPITSQRYEDQHASVKEMLERLRDRYSGHVQQLGLGPLVAQLEEFNEEYGKSLQRSQDGVNHADVRAANSEAVEAFSQVLIKVIHDYMHDLDELNDVMESFFLQEERLRRHYRRGNGQPVVDPETGETYAADEEVEVEPVDAGGESELDEESGEPGDVGDEADEQPSLEPVVDGA